MIWEATRNSVVPAQAGTYSHQFFSGVTT